LTSARREINALLNLDGRETKMLAFSSGGTIVLEAQRYEGYLERFVSMANTKQQAVLRAVGQLRDSSDASGIQSVESLYEAIDNACVDMLIALGHERTSQEAKV